MHLLTVNLPLLLLLQGNLVIEFALRFFFSNLYHLVDVINLNRHRDEAFSFFISNVVCVLFHDIEPELLNVSKLLHRFGAVVRN